MLFRLRFRIDLHRTGCSSYCGQEAERDRVVLKRVLLAYARWNKNVGYCQGFNILAALILEVVEGNEGDALKVSIRSEEGNEVLLRGKHWNHHFSSLMPQPFQGVCSTFVIIHDTTASRFKPGQVTDSRRCQMGGE